MAKDCPEGQDILAVHTGTSNPEKKWDAKRFGELCQRIESQENLKVVLVGGPEEKEYSSQIVHQSGMPIIDWTGRLSLKELVAFLGHQRVKALVSSDSGPVHLAWMSGTPVVALYAKNSVGSDPARWGPRDPQSEVIYKPMKDITSDEVFRTLEAVLQKCEKT